MTQNIKPILIGVTVSLLIAAGALAYTLYQRPGTTIEVTVPGAPAYLRIPALSVDSAVESVGRTPAGNMGSPTTLTSIAWFNEGPVPGERGSAVVAGHLDSALGRSGVFKNLEALQVGDEVLIETTLGEILRFRVIRTELYPYDRPPDDLFTRSDGMHLNLITCAGEWLQDRKTYSERLVVYTELAS